MASSKDLPKKLRLDKINPIKMAKGKIHRVATPDTFKLNHNAVISNSLKAR